MVIYCVYVYMKKNYLWVDIQHLCIDVCNIFKPHKQSLLYYKWIADFKVVLQTIIDSLVMVTKVGFWMSPQ